MNTCNTTSGDPRANATVAKETALPTVRPLTNLIETKEGFRLEFLLPGVAEKDVDVRVEGDLLVLRAMPSVEEPVDGAAEGWRLVRGEFELARFEHGFRLGRGVDPASIRAELKGGLLRIELKRMAPVEQRIPVRVA